MSEFIMAQRIFFCYGHHRSPYDSSWLTSVRPRKRYYELRDLQVFRDTRVVILSKMEYWHDNCCRPAFQSLADGEMDLLDIVGLIGGIKATDPRDKIYSVLAFLDKEGKAFVKPDYSLATEIVYAKATFASIKPRNDVQLLKFKKFGTDFGLPARLPLWAVNFNLGNFFVVGLHEINHYSDGHPGPALSSLGLPVVLDDSSMYLSLPGVTCDSNERTS